MHQSEFLCDKIPMKHKTMTFLLLLFTGTFYFVSFMFNEFRVIL